ncbi:hypothetical protein BJ508DRAFT_308466 [Ascobolus immersus RN42]|uniref:F-box domain-containing protein n=1 Tax=Ascobolus immersus RN42 TaxID=1160509 RepID=A0A3N4HZS0_ASCIM|nr:hypothetical protein BJ508DRAFT_308466 [Ascobolus immersus RN42]
MPRDLTIPKGMSPNEFIAMIRANPRLLSYQGTSNIDPATIPGRRGRHPLDSRGPPERDENLNRNGQQQRGRRQQQNNGRGGRDNGDSSSGNPSNSNQHADHPREGQRGQRYHNTRGRRNNANWAPRMPVGPWRQAINNSQPVAQAAVRTHAHEEPVAARPQIRDNARGGRAFNRHRNTSASPRMPEGSWKEAQILTYNALQNAPSHPQRRTHARATPQDQKNTPPPTTSFLHLPFELHLQISSYLPGVSSFLALQKTCKSLLTAYSHPHNLHLQKALATRLARELIWAFTLRIPTPARPTRAQRDKEEEDPEHYRHVKETREHDKTLPETQKLSPGQVMDILLTFSKAGIMAFVEAWRGEIDRTPECVRNVDVFGRGVNGFKLQLLEGSILALARDKKDEEKILSGLEALVESFTPYAPPFNTGTKDFNMIFTALATTQNIPAARIIQKCPYFDLNESVPMLAASPLYKACQAGNVEFVRYLVDEAGVLPYLFGPSEHNKAAEERPMDEVSVLDAVLEMPAQAEERTGEMLERKVEILEVLCMGKAGIDAVLLSEGKLRGEWKTVLPVPHGAGEATAEDLAGKMRMLKIGGCQSRKGVEGDGLMTGANTGVANGDGKGKGRSRRHIKKTAPREEALPRERVVPREDVVPRGRGARRSPADNGGSTLGFTNYDYECLS